MEAQFFFKGYRMGAAHLYDPPSDYNISLSYMKGNKVIYRIRNNGSYFGDNAVYQALQTIPVGGEPKGTNVVPDTTPAIVVDSESALNWLNTGNNGYPYLWLKVLDNFLGVNERASYSSVKLIYEYALNRWFNTSFRQPNGSAEDHVLNPLGTSDIYVLTNSTTYQFFWGQAASTSYFGPGIFPAYNYFTPDSNYVLPKDYSIYIPVASYNALISIVVEPFVIAGGNSTLRDGVVRAFADLISPAGSLYDIKTY